MVPSETNSLIICPIEITGRELVPKLFLFSKFINEKGGSCLIGDKQSCYEFLGKSNNQIYIDRGYHPEKSEVLYSKISKAHGLIVSLDEENGVDYEDFYTVNYRYPEKVFDIFSKIYLWGDAVNTFLAKNKKNYNEHKVVVSGHTRFQLLKKEYHYLYQKDVAEIKTKFGDFVLINTDFGFANNIDGKAKVREKYGSRVDRLDGAIKYQETQLENFLGMAAYLAKNITCNLVIRPHPEESKAPYLQLSKQYKNIHVIYEKSVIPWLIAAKCMIHHDCTTAVEFAMMGKRPISYAKDLDIRYCTDVPLKISKVCKNAEKVLENISSIESEKPSADQILVLEKFFTHSKNSTAEIIKNFPDPPALSKSYINKNYLSFRLCVLKLKLKDFLKLLLRKRPSLLHSNKLEGFNWRNINDTITRINRSEGTSIKVKQLSSYSYLLQNHDT